MEKHLGRKLKHTEAVHHKDGNIKNNDIDNLTVMPMPKHSQLHALSLWQNEEYQEKHKGQKNKAPSKLTPDNVRLIRKLLKYNYLAQVEKT
jgi:hypothetical protein